MPDFTQSRALDKRPRLILPRLRLALSPEAPGKPSGACVSLVYSPQQGRPSGLWLMHLTYGLSYALGVQNVCDVTEKGMSWGK